MQAVWDRLFGKAYQLVDSPTLKWNKTISGISGVAAAAGQGGGSLTQCVITQLYNENYIGVTRYSGTSGLVGSQFFCAKCVAGRMPAQETIDGQLVTYSQYGSVLLPVDNSDNVRLATYDSVNNEYQVMHRRYLTHPTTDIGQCLVYVCRISGNTNIDDPDGNPITYLEVSPNREWAYSPYLNGGNS